MGASFRCGPGFSGVWPGRDPLSRQWGAQCLLREVALALPSLLGICSASPAPCSSSAFLLQPRLCQQEEKEKPHTSESPRRREGGRVVGRIVPSKHNQTNNNCGCDHWKQMAFLMTRKEGLSTCVLSVCPSRLECGVQLKVSISLKLPKAEVLMSLTL